MAAHYDVGVLPARPRRPRDKAKVETGVRVAQLYILGRLRHETFFSLADANRAISGAVERINNHVMRRLGLSRKELFETIDWPAMRTLPKSNYEFAVWQFARVNIDYHIEVDKFFYSVPYQLIHQQVDVRITRSTIEIFHRAERVAIHQRRYAGPRHGTDLKHMPSAHRRYASWNPRRLQRWARTIGPTTENLVVAVLANRPHPEQGFRTCLGILRLFRGFDRHRAEAVAAHALAINAFNYRSITSIVTNNLDRSQPTQPPTSAILEHSNLRGRTYFN